MRRIKHFKRSSKSTNYVRLVLVYGYGTAILNVVVLSHAIEEIKRSRIKLKNTLAPKQVNRVHVSLVSPFQAFS